MITVIFGCSKKPVDSTNLVLAWAIGNIKMNYDSSITNSSATTYKFVVNTNSLCSNSAAHTVITVNNMEVLNQVYESSAATPVQEIITVSANATLYIHTEVTLSSQPNIVCPWTGEAKFKLLSD